MTRKILLALAAVAFTSLCAEWGLEWHDQRAQPLELGGQHKPYYPCSLYSTTGVRLGDKLGMLKLQIYPATMYRNMPNQKTPFFSINSRGFRGPEVGPKDPKIKRIILVGGSTAFGTGLDSDSDSFAAQLQRKLAGTETVNAAVVGHESGQELSYVFSELIDFSPDVLLTLDGYNDCFEGIRRAQSGESLRGLNTFGFEMLESRLIDVQSLTLATGPSRLFQLLPFIFPATVARLQHVIEQRAATKSLTENKEFLVDIGPVAETYARNMGKMAALAHATHRRFLCVIQPGRPAETGNTLEEKMADDYATFRTLAKDKLRRLNVDTLDLNDFSSELPRARFMDEMHLDAQGNEIMARIVSEKIKAMRWMTP